MARRSKSGRPRNHAYRPVDWRRRRSAASSISSSSSVTGRSLAATESGEHGPSADPRPVPSDLAIGTRGANDGGQGRRMAEAPETAPDQSGDMTQPVSAPASAFAPLRIWVHALVGVAIGLISPFTGLAWPFAILLGMAFGSSSA